MQHESKSPKSAYQSAGVDIAEGNRFVEAIRQDIDRTKRPEVLSKLGHYAGLFQISKNYKEPVLVSSTDGVGTKLKLAIDMNRFDAIGIDLVAMCVNDLLCMGAEPLFFLDYIASHRLDVERASQIIKGITEGCLQSGSALLGGETAEMPLLYQKGDCDLAGFAVGVVEKSRIIDGRTIQPGQKIIGISSSGVHSNGFSLIHKILKDSHTDLSDRVAGLELPIGEELLKPTRIYVKTIARLKEEFTLHGIAHITGGGLVENPPRLLPEACAITINTKAWKRPPLFDWIQTTGKVSASEMWQVFNCGIGLILVVEEKETAAILQRLVQCGEKAFLLGEIIPRKKGEAPLTLT